MRGIKLGALAIVVIGQCCPLRLAYADPTAQTASGIPPQIVPAAPEVGLTILTIPGSTPTATSGTTTGSSTATGSTTGSGSDYDDLMATSYGTAAAQAASAAGINVDALAAIGEAESNLGNVPTANGSTSATGVWQVTEGTFMQYSNEYGLGYTAADASNPADEAQVASYIIADYANTVSNSTGQPATVVQTYGAYVFGPTAGSAIATANASEPLSNYVSSTALANNNMSGWTVGQFESTMSSRLGSAANEVVKT